MPKLKTNEQITKEWEQEENEKQDDINFQLLMSNITKVTNELRELQRKYKIETGKNYHVF